MGDFEPHWCETIWKSWKTQKSCWCTLPPGMKKLDTGQSDILVLADVPSPPPEIEIGLNMNAIGKRSFQERSSSTFYQSTPPSIIIIWFYAWTGKWWISISNGFIDLNPIHHPSPAKKIKCSFLDYVQLLMISWAGWWTQTPLPPLSSKKNKMLIFGLHSTSDDRPGWSMDSNPICHPSPAKK